MKKSLFGKGNFYKANLHNHTVCSDGSNTPEEIKKFYTAQNYQIVAFSDHDIILDHSDLNDESFLALTAFEYEFTEEHPSGIFSFRRTYHLVTIAPEADWKYYPWPNPDYSWGNARKYIQPYYVGNCPHDYDIDHVNSMIKDAQEHGCLVTYCHPHWSTQHYPDYCGLIRPDFVETFNSGCVQAGWDLDGTDAVYNDFLWLGKRCAPTASDDGHGENNYCLGATYIKAEDLSYESIFAALKNQDVYASWGPQINDISFDPETGELTVDCVDAKCVSLCTERRYAERFFPSNGAPVSKAVFNLKQYIDDTVNHADPSAAFIRIVVEDAEGKKALSRGYFVDELLAE